MKEFSSAIERDHLVWFLEKAIRLRKGLSQSLEG